MRSLLEKAIVHLLNEDNDAAVSLFHQFMVERARQIHNSLRQGEEVSLSEGWDDELGKEEYFASDDLSDLEDHEDTTDGEESPISGAEGEEGMGDEGADVGDDFGDEGEEGMDGDEGAVVGRLDDIEDQLEELTREFEQMMSELDVDGGEEGVEGEDDFENMAGDEEGAEMGDEGGEFGAEEEPVEDDAMTTESEEVDEEDLDDITESVIAELEKVLVGDMQTDGEEIGAGKKITQNQKSTLTMKKANADDASPKGLVSKQSKHDGYERETPPVSPKPVKLKSRNKINDTSGKPSDLKSVPKGGDSSALLNKDFAGLKKGNTKSVID